ncbi:branched-chain amino acid ABC transporter permease [Pusillimonas sp.]|uniref:branched-chain amino acid ABC transporter permease n=1 Tax=Pusillimonas sp. TaxID=3040095 RepID=UPI0037C58036
MKNHINLRVWVGGALMLAFAVLPIIAHLIGESYFITYATRILIMALAAAGLNIALGYGGMISLGHALYLGLGAYAVGICAHHGIASGWVQLLIALAVGGALACVLGLICLRTKGMAFIMITLAFAQMFYFLVVTLDDYGGDDGLPIAARSIFGNLNIENSTVFYYLSFAVLAATLLFTARMVKARFGRVIRGCHSNHPRMLSLGYDTMRYRLAAYVISALICVIAGFLLANLVRFASPSYLMWIVSGELMVMVILGGMGTVMGPVVGAVVVLLIEAVFANSSFGLPTPMATFINDHWMAVLGIVVVLGTMLVEKGLYGSLPERRNRV